MSAPQRHVHETRVKLELGVAQALSFIGLLLIPIAIRSAVDNMMDEDSTESTLTLGGIALGFLLLSYFVKWTANRDPYVVLPQVGSRGAR